MYPIQLTNNDNRPTSNPTESTHPDAIDTRNIPMSPKTKNPKVQTPKSPNIPKNPKVQKPKIETFKKKHNKSTNQKPKNPNIPKTPKIKHHPKPKNPKTKTSNKTKNPKTHKIKHSYQTIPIIKKPKSQKPNHWRYSSLSHSGWSRGF